MRKIVDYAVYELHVNTNNKLLTKDFLVEKKSQGKAETTLKQYEGDLKIINYLIYKHFENKDLTDLTRKDIRNLAILFQEMEMSNARVNRLMSSLRSTLEFCADDDDYNYDFNIGSRVKGLPKNPVREITFLEEEQIEWMVNRLIEENRLLVAVYLSLSYYSAARKNEVYQVQKEGLTERYFTNIVKGKGNKKFRLYYNEQTQKLIAAYLQQRGDDDIPNLFVKKHKDGTKSIVTKHAFSYWCEIMEAMLSKREGKRISINPHCFRHSRLDNLKKQGVPIEKLKSLANHNDISTTAAYLADRSEEDIADIFGMDANLFKS